MREIRAFPRREASRKGHEIVYQCRGLFDFTILMAHCTAHRARLYLACTSARKIRFKSDLKRRLSSADTEVTTLPLVTAHVTTKSWSLTSSAIVFFVESREEDSEESSFSKGILLFRSVLDRIEWLFHLHRQILSSSSRCTLHRSFNSSWLKVVCCLSKIRNFLWLLVFGQF